MTETPPPTFDPDSIFDTIKKLLNIDVEDSAFDMDIVVHINTALMALTQIGVGPAGGFVITDRTSKWSDFIGNSMKLGAIQTYIFLKVRVVFDPPTNSTTLEAFNNAISEFEFRLNVNAETV